MPNPTSWEVQPAAKWESYSWDYLYRRNLLNWLMEMCPNKDSTILDVGCLQGQYINKMRSLGYVGKYKGVDLSPYFLEKAKEVNPQEVFEQQNVLEIK